MMPTTAVQFPSTPSDTSHASAAAFGKNHPYLKIGDRLNAVFSDVNLEKLAAMDGRLADSFWLNSLATVLQYWENLTDTQMANATRTRVDLKYALHLPLIYPGIDPSTLCSFRQRMLYTPVAMAAFQQVVENLDGLIGEQENPLPEANLLISTICAISRWETVRAAMINAVEALAASQPEWLRTIALPHWYQRYYYSESLRKNIRVSKDIQSSLKSVGEDGRHLLDAIEKSGNRKLVSLPEVRYLCQEWQNQFEGNSERLGLRSQNCSNCDSRFE